MIFCTVTSNKHKYLAAMMANSLKQFHPESKVVICFVEENIQLLQPVTHFFDHVVLAKDLGFSNFYKHMFKHNDYEGAGSCKARLLSYIYQTFIEEQQFIYIDADTRVFGPFEEISALLLEAPIVLTPHRVYPAFNLTIGFTKVGVYNSGIVGIHRSEEAERFLQWWVYKLDYSCYIDRKRGLFSDQKWLDLVPGMFHTAVLRHPGYNVGPWNLPERKIYLDENGQWLVNGLPLRFFHFSGFLRGRRKTLLRKVAKNTPLHVLLLQYMEGLRELGENFSYSRPWSYNFFYTGEVISNKSRRLYRYFPIRYKEIGNPFFLSNRFFLRRKQKQRKRSTAG